MDMCPKDLVCDRKTWYVPERPGMISKTLACVRKRCHVHSYCVRNIWHVLENQIRKKWIVLLVVISVSDKNCIPESTNNQPVTLDLYMCFLKRIETSELEMC